MYRVCNISDTASDLLAKLSDPETSLPLKAALDLSKYAPKRDEHLTAIHEVGCHLFLLPLFTYVLQKSRRHSGCHLRSLWTLTGLSSTHFVSFCLFDVGFMC